MKFTIENLKVLEPCEPGFKWYLENIKSENPREILLQLNNYRADWARWLTVRLLTKEKNQKLAIFAAESVLEIYERAYPKNKEVRECIQAAKDYLVGKISKEDLLKKRKAAANATYAAAYAAYAADAATYAADAATYAANAADAADAAYAAAYAANAAANATDAATYAANAADAARKITQEKIINYACDLLEE